MYSWGIFPCVEAVCGRLIYGIVTASEYGNEVRDDNHDPMPQHLEYKYAIQSRKLLAIISAINPRKQYDLCPVDSFFNMLSTLDSRRGSWACAFEGYVDSRGQQFSWSRFTTVFSEIHTIVIQCFTFIQIKRNTTKWQITSSSKTGVRHVVMQSRRFICYGFESMPQDIYSPYWSSGQIRVSGHGINIFINNLSLLSFGGNEHKFL